MNYLEKYIIEPPQIACNLLLTLIIPTRHDWMTVQEISEAYPEVTAMKTKSSVPGEWKTWTYNRLYDDIHTIAKE